MPTMAKCTNSTNGGHSCLKRRGKTKILKTSRIVVTTKLQTKYDFFPIAIPKFLGGIPSNLFAHMGGIIAKQISIGRETVKRYPKLDPSKLSINGEANASINTINKRIIDGTA
jgi:hypothetical protein